MRESNLLALIVLGALLVLGLALLSVRLRQAIRNRSSVKQMLKSAMRTPPLAAPRDRAHDQKFLERMLNGEVDRPDASRPAATPRDAAVEQTFRTMFFTSADKGEGLIEYYIKRHRCDRNEAMRHAIKDREREGRD